MRSTGAIAELLTSGRNSLFKHRRNESGACAVHVTMIPIQGLTLSGGIAADRFTTEPFSRLNE